MATSLQGIVADITFRSPENGFTVLRVQTDPRSKPVVCVGPMPTLERGVPVALNGTWETHPRFGPQFSVVSYEILRPRTREAITALLGSGLIPHLGEAKAAKIVELFGEQTLDILDNQPDRLLEVPGIGKKIFAKIKDAWTRQRSIRELMLFLQEFGVSVGLTLKIHAAYGEKARQVISQNPYALIDDIWGVGFKRADAIARKLGFEHDSYRRIRAGIRFTLEQALSDGHTFLPRHELIQSGVALLEVDREKVIYTLDQAAQAGQGIICEDDRFYLSHAHGAEVETASLLLERIAAAEKSAGRRADVDAWLAAYCIKAGWQGDPLQIEAVGTALSSPLFLLTGGPGTGKTTTLQVIVSFLRERNLSVSLAAPTGRAAQRMGSIAGISAQTIHRLLEFRPGKDGYVFSRNRDNPLDAAVVILDEVSMVDIFLMRSLLRAIRPETVLIMVGDKNQLPSVGPGNVLADMIASGAIPYVNLTAVFRQAARSAIIRCAHDIINGRQPRFTNDAETDCFFLSEENPESALTAVVDLVSSRLPRRYRFDPVCDIQVLAPMHKGVLGTHNLNQALQRVLNPAAGGIVRGEVCFRRGDRVMQIRNNYDSGVFNGDIGFVADVEESALTVDFDGRTVRYEGLSLDEIVHAYCISIHKSQGCEFKAVVIPLVSQHYIMLRRNLVYTAITRARNLCVVVGSNRALTMAITNSDAERRFSMLSRRIAHRQQTMGGGG